MGDSEPCCTCGEGGNDFIGNSEKINQRLEKKYSVIEGKRHEKQRFIIVYRCCTRCLLIRNDMPRDIWNSGIEFSILWSACPFLCS